MSERLDSLVDELRALAARLRADDLPPDEAAELVESCAELAARIGAELDSEGRAATETEGQERLL